MNQPKPKIALFVGSDVIAHREMVPVVQHMVENDFEPLLFYPAPPPSKNKNAGQQTFKDYAYLERLILNETIFPHLESNPEIKAKYATPKQITERYRLQAPVNVADINNPAFYTQLANDPNLIGTISLRCTQMFRAGITDALTQNGRFLLNVHSGLLPQFRGLYSTPRAIFEKLANPDTARGEFGCTVHHVDPFIPQQGENSKRYAGIDTGNIVEFESAKIIDGMSVYATNMILSKMASETVINIINRYMRGSTLTGYSQNETLGNYYSYASADELKAWDKAGLVMFEREEAIHLLSETFKNRKGECDTEQVIRKAVNDYFDKDHKPPFNCGKIIPADTSLQSRFAHNASNAAQPPQPPRQIIRKHQATDGIGQRLMSFLHGRGRSHYRTP